MKKLSVLLVAAAVAISASAGVNFKSTHALKSNKITKEMVKTNVKDLKAGKASFRVITEQPEGELKSYNRAGQCVVYNSGSGLVAKQQDGNRMDIVYGENGKVYLKNIICGIANNFGDSWVEGQISEDGTTITVPMGQSIYYSDYYGADVVLAYGQSTIDEDGYFGIDIDDRVEEAIYTIDGNVITLEGTDGPTEIDPYEDASYLAYGLTAYWTDNDSWSGFIEWNTVLTEREPVVAPTVITEQPEGELVTYYRAGDCIYNSIFGLGLTEVDGKFNVVYTEDGKAYIQNPLWWFDSYGTWVEGTYDAETGIITVPAGQFLTWSDEYEYGIQLMWGSTYVYSDVDPESGEEGYYLGTELDERTTEILFQVDGDNLILLGSEGDATLEFPENYNATGLYAMYSDDQTWAGDLEFNMTGNHVVATPAVPEDPTMVSWYDEGDETGWNTLDFTLPTTDVDGNMLDPDYLSYSVYLDNGNGPEIFTFTPEEYTYDNLAEPMTEIPASIFNSGVEFHKSYIYFYHTFTGMTQGYEPFFTHNIGIRVFYTVDGVKNANAGGIIWAFDPNTSVDEVNASKTVASVRYFNVAGQEMAQPQGMTIKVTTYTDGTTSAAKVVK
ncbi:MAG: hypothetical protein IJV05_01580 [Muribaculaceae bacterium]|nr:hypothetical protein [Muribaculaceae bacterium]